MGPVILQYTSRLLLTALIAIAGSATAAAADLRSVILIIGDGFDDPHVTMARNYLSGHDGELLLDGMPMRGAVQVETIDTDGTPLYVADSANTATSLASGVVTNIGRVGTDSQDRDAPTVLEAAANAGYRTGIVSTASVTDATPASFVAHVATRSCENPEALQGEVWQGISFDGCPQDASDQGGPGSIAEQIINSSVDVVLGGGARHFQYRLPGTESPLTSVASEAGFDVVYTAEDLLEVSPERRLLGLFAPSHLAVRLRGENDSKAQAPEVTPNESGTDQTVTQPAAMTCEPNPAFSGTPALATLTRVALEHLASDNSKGLFLMIESASIDKQSHRRNPCGSIGEVAQLEESLEVALEFARQHPETLILVTADHGQAAQIIPEPSLYDRLPMPIHSPGKVARIKTPEGGIMRINYATNNYRSAEHTGANVPLFGNSEALGRVKPFLRQRDIYRVMMDYLKLEH